MCLIPVAASAAWVEVKSGGATIPGWYQDTETGNYQTWNDKGFVKEYTVKEFDTYKTELEAYGGAAGESDTGEQLFNTIYKDTPGLNEAGAEDAQHWIEQTREAPADGFKGVPVEGELGEGLIDNLDGVAVDAGTLADPGGLPDAAALGGSDPVIAPLLLGASAFELGTLIGNDLDEVLEIPSWFGAQETAVADHPGAAIHFLSEQCAGSKCVHIPGYYIECRGNEFGETLHYNPFREEPTEIHYGCVGTASVTVSEPCLVESGRCGEPGYLNDDEHEYKDLCLTPTEVEHPLVGNCHPAVLPLTVPKPEPMPLMAEEGDVADGLGSSPHTPVETEVKTDVQTQHLHGAQPYKLLLPSPTDPGFSEKDGIPRTKKPKEEELEREVGKSPKTEAEPLAKYTEENSPEQSKAETEPAPEPESGPALGPPTLPGFIIPSFAVACTGFPFGVPCWFIHTVEGWSASSTCPHWGIEEFDIDSKKIAGSKFNLCELEPVMEKVRPAMLIFITIGLVMLFYRLARGGSPPSGGGTDDVSPEND